MLPERDPPASTTGVIGWMRQNLFSSFVNSILTLLSLAFIIWGLAAIIPWLISPTWEGTSLSNCREIISEAGREGGACWGVVNERWPQLLYGFYPSDLRWRPNLAFALLFVALIPVLFNMISRRMNWVLLLLVLLGGTFAADSTALIWILRAALLVGAALIGLQMLTTSKGDRADEIASGARRLPNPLIFTALYPFIAPWLLWGGDVWIPLLVLAGFAVAYIVYRAVAAFAGSLAGVIVSLVAVALWWLVFTSLINGAVSAAIGHARIDTIQPKLEAEISALKAESDALATTLGEIDPRSPEGQALGRAKARADGIMQRRKEMLSSVTSLPQAEAALEELRAAPAPTVPEELEAYERDIAFREDSLRASYSAIGLVGLEPVASRYFGGLMLSLTIGVVAIVTSLPIGILLALGRQSDLLIVKYLSVGFIEFIRGVPLITLLFVASVLLNYFLPPGTNFDIILRVIIMATIFSSAYMAEVIRGGLAALPKGQYEAADALGLDYWKAQRLIIMPQALKISIPGIVSTFIGMFKDTTLVSIIGLLDPVGLTKSIQADANWNGIIWELYGFIALLFFIFTFSMSRYSMYLERRLRTDHR